MATLGNIVIYLMMAFVVIGACALAFRGDRGIGREFKEGIYALGPLFVPVAGIMAGLPYLAWFVEHVLGKIYAPFGADAAMAATTLIASDMGGYQLAKATADSTGAWMTASITGFLSGATISFIIPVGLAILNVRDHKYFALGIMSGILTVPIGVLVTMGILITTHSPVRDSVTTDGASTATLDGFGIGDVLINMLPVIIVTVAIAAGLYFATRAMITGFIWFGRILNAAIYLVLAVSIVDHVTGFFSSRLSWWGFEPIIATADDQMRALEVVGNIAIVLAGAFPLVYAIRTYVDKPLTVIGKRLGISTEGTAGLLAATTNMLAAFHLIRSMPAKDKVLVVAFGTTSSALIGDHLAFTANFQPNLIAPLMIGKVVAGVTAMLLALWIAVPTAKRLEREDAEIETDLTDDDAERTDDEDQQAPEPARS
ncbi:ethanolamine utilization protein EutH [Mycobacterium sp. NS-7484]|uniref:ethanolamine utilization protein EutH n=1 Tax=Mycobacterium sp. NS-7484 TaxID=1834161 RepID=UPI00096C105E|nr:ethanolamine utilization protein EutH [Mycobacterium sp. NS-7484]OMB99057.1 ethanolamine utilization protein EutH [Mycobacterium sp. NS-7484]